MAIINLLTVSGALILLHDIISRHLDSNSTAAVVLSWDYTHAFDCNDHFVLLKKLKEHNFPLEFISFIADNIVKSSLGEHW